MSSLWAITSYFNPMRSARRLANYRTFRRHLNVPLVAVELERERADLELEPGDADALIQLVGENRLWQKERLLNVALAALPAECRAVAWLDCDLVWDRDDWAERVSAALERVPVVQCFTTFAELTAEATLNGRRPSATLGSGSSVASRLATGMTVDEVFQPAGSRLQRRLAPGFAWAARRDVLGRHGLYDACILGGGDKAIAVAALGRYKFVNSLDLNTRQTAHYLAWAQPFFADVRGRIGYVEGTVYHLWHGELGTRKHRTRHREFRRFAFNPYADIALDACGCWRWNSNKPDMHAYLHKYFAARNEDARGLA